MKETKKRSWKKVMSLFRQQKTLDASSKVGHSTSLHKTSTSDMTSSGVSDCISENNHSVSLDTISEGINQQIQTKVFKLSEPILKRNSITPSDILTPNRMALSPIEMQLVFSVKEDATLYSSDFDEHSLSSEVSNSSVGQTGNGSKAAQGKENGQEKLLSKSLKKIAGAQNELKTEIHKNKDNIKSLKSEADKQQSIVTSYRKKMSKTLFVLKKDLAKIIVTSKGPVFSGAFRNGGILRLYSNEVIKFTAVDINRGGGYDPNTGVFTVPRPGVYIISSTLRSYNGIRFHCYLWKNNEKLAFLYGSNMNTGTVHIVRKLKIGDQLYIKHMYRRGENEAIQKGRASMFSVAFLSDD
ncbi:unnamed protein product [Mytilus coruscus]|uniref:C1q domain-containing protein n=1 Tax=Mytilus coruscus TaxID=42192 RepID=A0A6J8BN05_MYTCO|nr:unnamed protein product [Mytilus coruscus]